MILRLCNFFTSNEPNSWTTINQPTISDVLDLLDQMNESDYATLDGLELKDENEISLTISKYNNGFAIVRREPEIGYFPQALENCGNMSEKFKIDLGCGDMGLISSNYFVKRSVIKIEVQNFLNGKFHPENWVNFKYKQIVYDENPESIVTDETTSEDIPF